MRVPNDIIIIEAESIESHFVKRAKYIAFILLRHSIHELFASR